MLPGEVTITGRNPLRPEKSCDVDPCHEHSGALKKSPEVALATIASNLKSNQRVFIGVIDVNDNTVESAETVKERVMTAARHIPADQLGTTDDCGFSPFGDDLATARDTAFAKITARVEGTRLASEALGL